MAIDIARFAEEELGLTLTPAQREMVTSFTGGGFSQAVWQCGRRGGKSLLADVLVLADVALRDDLRSKLRRGEPRISAVIAPRQDQSQAHITNLLSLIGNSPLLSKMLVSTTESSIEFSNGSVVRSLPASARGLRGGAFSMGVLDELGHFLTSEDGNAAGDRILEAVMPSLAQFGNDGWLIAISTPLWKSGAFYKLCERARSGRFPSYHYRHLTTAQLNPAIPAAWLEQRKKEDPDSFRQEFEATFIDGASSYLNSQDINACMRESNILPPRGGNRYVAAADPAYSQDNWSLAIGHSEDGFITIDGVWVWYRGGHEATINEVAQILNHYGIRSVRIDQHSRIPVQESLARVGISGEYVPWSQQNKQEAFSALKIALSQRSIELPNDDELISELNSIEARPTSTGLTRIAGASGSKDDRAVVVAAVVDELAGSGLGIAVIDMASDTGYGPHGYYETDRETGQRVYGKDPYVESDDTDDWGPGWERIA
jgi:hypothetical protein